MLSLQAPCLTPEWTRTDHGQTVFYTEQRCIPLQGQCPFHCLTGAVEYRPLMADSLCDRSKSGSGGADGGGAPAAGVSARSPEPL